uniref:ABC-2 type transporter n=1 Tax=Timspurckia oligopyrenoides TaxID=708627 RepID=UPI001FCD8DD4|nr:ABC-2 type transporter [Timspurckia oligopyrenoides]UNJ17534.1 ABC-2 type transporter [Timspurckia oligopyrenoides]
MKISEEKVILRPKVNPEFKSDSSGLLKSMLSEIYGLAERLFIQLSRRFSTLIAGIVQPLLWLFLFGALFKNISLTVVGTNIGYQQLLVPGIIVFTAFSGALNAGLSIIFDREFGFFNRLLVCPMDSRISILLASIVFITLTTLAQVLAIMLLNLLNTKNYLDIAKFAWVIFVIVSITVLISLISITLAFILPGHIELLAFILIINLPILFSSTALAPITMMPHWLQVIASWNPLTYAIEGIRLISLKEYDYTFISYYGNITLITSLSVLAKLNLLSFFGIFVFFHKKY